MFVRTDFIYYLSIPFCLCVIQMENLLSFHSVFSSIFFIYARFFYSLGLETIFLSSYAERALSLTPATMFRNMLRIFRFNYNMLVIFHRFHRIHHTHTYPIRRGIKFLSLALCIIAVRKVSVI